MRNEHDNGNHNQVRENSGKGRKERRGGGGGEMEK